MSKNLRCPQGQNNLIATLTEEDQEIILPHLSAVTLSRGMILERPDHPIDTIYFPVTGVGSMVAIGKDERRIEVGLFGREGMSGTAILSQSDQTPNETFMQVAGHGLSIPADSLRDILSRHPSIQSHLLRFLHVLLIQTSQTALSNGHAKLEERLARWLLMCDDRIDGDEMTLTHEFLAIMLGVRRAGVTVGTHILEGKGLIRATRGRITILDRAGLESASLQSYGVPEAEYARLIG